MILAFDVTDRIASLSWRPEGKDCQTETITKGKATDFLLPAIQRITQTTAEPLTAIGVIKGPGSFTGIRVGLATAMGLATSLNIPAYGFTKYQLAQGVFENGELLLPAGKGRTLAAPFVDGVQEGEPRVLKIDELDPATTYRTLADIGEGNVPALDLNLTVTMIQHIEAGVAPEAHTLEPLYIRPPDAIRGRGLIHKLLDKSG